MPKFVCKHFQWFVCIYLPYSPFIFKFFFTFLLLPPLYVYFSLLWRRANARNVSQHTLYGVQHIHINLTLIHCTFYLFSSLPCLFMSFLLSPLRSLFSSLPLFSFSLLRFFSCSPNGSDVIRLGFPGGRLTVTSLCWVFLEVQLQNGGRQRRNVCISSGLLLLPRSRNYRTRQWTR